MTSSCPGFKSMVLLLPFQTSGIRGSITIDKKLKAHHGIYPSRERQFKHQPPPTSFKPFMGWYTAMRARLSAATACEWLLYLFNRRSQWYDHNRCRSWIKGLKPPGKLMRSTGATVQSPLHTQHGCTHTHTHIWASHGPHRVFRPRVNWVHERVDPIRSTKRKKIWKFCTVYQSRTSVPC